MRKIQNSIYMIRPPATKAITGVVNNPENIFIKPFQLISFGPKPAIAAPTNPPIKAWDELLGIPKYQVKRFQNMAPMRAALKISGVTTSGLMIPLPIVAATAVPLKAPKKFKLAATIMAARGLKALVETEVAIALAVS